MLAQSKFNSEHEKGQQQKGLIALTQERDQARTERDQARAERDQARTELSVRFSELTNCRTRIGWELKELGITVAVDETATALECLQRLLAAQAARRPAPAISSGELDTVKAKLAVASGELAEAKSELAERDQLIADIKRTTVAKGKALINVDYTGISVLAAVKDVCQYLENFATYLDQIAKVIDCSEFVGQRQGNSLRVRKWIEGAKADLSATKAELAKRDRLISEIKQHLGAQ